MIGAGRGLVTAAQEWRRLAVDFECQLAQAQSLINDSGDGLELRRQLVVQARALAEAEPLLSLNDALWLVVGRWIEDRDGDGDDGKG